MTDPDRAATDIERASLIDEATRIVAAAEAAGAIIRVLGSVAVAIRGGDVVPVSALVDRTYRDIDFAAYRRDSKVLAALLTSMGYRANQEVYLASEGARSIFDDPIRGLHLDLFYDRLEFCHTLPLAGRLERDPMTIPLSELVLSKLQIVEINERDLADVISLLLAHPIGGDEREHIDVDRIAALCANEWGLWRTVTINLDKTAGLAGGLAGLDADQRSHVLDATTSIKARIDAEPKPLAWRMRDRVGDRRQWWVDVEEVR